jgi:formylglycine-generating enzyme required for sulfatase activity
MKYEITQQGYVDFLNSLTQAQATIRKQDKYDIIAYNHRYEITGSVIGSYATTNPFVACNHLGWSDVAAYLDWCGLRPMTEFEFEKSCRGTLPSVPNEYAWGTTGIASSAYTLSNSGLTNENIATNYSTSLGNAALMLTTPYQGSIDGPVRVGIFAGNGLNTGRVSSGATYYGIMEMTGNVWEKIVTVGNPTGRTFTGTHGNGLLTVTGDADALLWPNADALGAGVCGSNWYHSDGSGRVSERHQATYSLAAVQRHWMGGGRGVRSMP